MSVERVPMVGIYPRELVSSICIYMPSTGSLAMRSPEVVTFGKIKKIALGIYVIEK